MGVKVYLQTEDGGGGARRFRHREPRIENLENRSGVGGAGSNVRLKVQRRIFAARVYEQKKFES
jgi:GTPase involved in cell partitioning and DNA repair